VRRILEAAGLEAVETEPADLAMHPGGGDLDEAADMFLEVGPLAFALHEANAPEALRGKVRAAVREAFASHVRDGRVELGSAIWLVRARRGL
jgi:hypothetical protein